MARIFFVTMLGSVKKYIMSFAKDDKGVGVVELILILVVLIGLVVIVRDQVTSLSNGIFQRIVDDSSAV